MIWKKPTVYSSNIYAIPYQKLKDKNIKYLLFDLDNTIIPSNKEKLDDDTILFFKKLQEQFEVIIVSNSLKKRVKSIAEQLQIPYYSFALKPMKKTFRILKQQYHCEYAEMAMIGDQWYTDILGGNRLHLCTILVDPVSEYDFFMTKVNRYFEKKLLKSLNFEKGRYYD